MRYEHTPRPEIEHHYHIKELIDSQETRASDRNYHRDKQKEKDERDALIRDAKGKEVKEFWCSACKEDFYAESIKEVEVDWSNPSQRVSFYRSKCFKGHWCIRLITDRHKDGYWFKSKRVAQDKGLHALDTLQPYQTGFNTLYKKI